MAECSESHREAKMLFSIKIMRSEMSIARTSYKMSELSSPSKLEVIMVIGPEAGKKKVPRAVWKWRRITTSAEEREPRARGVPGVPESPKKQGPRWRTADKQ